PPPLQYLPQPRHVSMPKNAEDARDQPTLPAITLAKLNGKKFHQSLGGGERDSLRTFRVRHVLAPSCHDLRSVMYFPAYAPIPWKTTVLSSVISSMAYRGPSLPMP